MKIKLYNGLSASEEELLNFQDFLGCPLSEGVKNFLRRFDGAEPEPNIFLVDRENESGVNRFIPLRKISKELVNMRGLSGRAYPIAWAEGGNYVVIDEDDHGVVYFWDHELAEPLTKIADDFDSFLDRIRPFDLHSMNINPNQIKKAWIDPDFLKRVKGK